MKIQFYILPSADEQKSFFYTCHVIEKKYKEHPSLYIHTHSQQEAERLDSLLWTFRDTSFLPHQLYDPTSPAPIQIGYGEKPLEAPQILVNLRAEMPSFYAEFTEIVEIVFSNPTVQQLARERYRQYRDLGHDLTTFKIKTSDFTDV